MDPVQLGLLVAIIVCAVALGVAVGAYLVNGAIQNAVAPAAGKATPDQDEEEGGGPPGPTPPHRLDQGRRQDVNKLMRFLPVSVSTSPETRSLCPSTLAQGNSDKASSMSAVSSA